MHLIDEALNYSLRGEFDKAKEISDYLESLGPDKIVSPTGEVGSPDTWIRHCFNRAWHFYRGGEFQKASKLIEYGRLIDCYGDGNVGCGKPIFDPENHNPNSTVLVSLEGGYGDQIIQFRFLPGMRKFNVKVILCSHPDLESIFKRNNWADEYTSKSILEEIEFDYWIPGFSLGWICGYEFDENFPNKPYLSCKSESVLFWKDILDKPYTNKFKVGIRWAGNQKFEHQQFRKFNPSYLTNLEKYDKIQLYSFQRDKDIIELSPNIVDLQHILISWEDTLAALECMDLVITSCTSIAHASAAIGKETWVITPTLPYTQWATGAPEATNSLWYECVTVFRQGKNNDWDETFKNLYLKLENRISSMNINVQKPFLDSDSVIISKERKSSGRLIFSCSFEQFGIKEFEELAEGSVIVDTSGQLFDTIISIANVNRTAFLKDETIYNLLSVIFEEYINSYSFSDINLIVNNDYRWTFIINLLNKVFNTQTKLLCFVMNPIELLSAIELARINDPLAFELKLSTLNDRCFYYLSEEHPIGKLKSNLMDLFIKNYDQNLCFIDYDNLINTPKRQFQRISEFFNLSNFTTDKKLEKEIITPTQVLGVDIISRFGTSLFWERSID